jgi:hypothetical protein
MLCSGYSFSGRTSRCITRLRTPLLIIAVRIGTVPYPLWTLRLEAKHLALLTTVGRTSIPTRRVRPRER